MSIVNTAVNPFAKAAAANLSDAAFPALAPTITEPTGAGVVDLCDLAAPSQRYAANAVQVLLFGSDAADETFSHRLVGWSKAGSVWIPVPVIEVVATLGTLAGVEGGDLADTDLLADTIAASETIAPQNYDFLSPANNTVAWYMANVMGFSKLQFQFALGVSAASANALYRLL